MIYRKSRIIGRNGFFDIDGDPFPESVIKSACTGSETDADLLHLSIRDMIFNTNGGSLDRVSLELDLENGYWLTEQYDEAGRYADDILDDWIKNKSMTAESLYDITNCYIRMLRLAADALPKRIIRMKDWKFTAEYGTSPASIYPPHEPPRYTYGEGHSVMPDYLTHPLIKHISEEDCLLKQNGQIHGAVPHNQVDCVKFDRHVNTGRPLSIPARACADKKKRTAIQDALDGIQPEVSVVCEEGARHSMLVAGDVDISVVYGMADSIQEQFGTPLDCLACDMSSLHQMLYHDLGGNDAKRIAKNVAVLGSMDEFPGHVMPPRPATVTRADMLYNLDRHGFDMIVRRILPHSKDVRVEYAIAATHFSLEPRWYMTGTAVMLCKNMINWYLMLYLARKYRFVGTLYGVLLELEKKWQRFQLAHIRT